MRWCHIPIFQSESVITVTRTTVAVQAFQFLNISFCYTLFCFFLQLVNHPLRTLLRPWRGPDFQLVVIAAMVTSYARSSSSIKARNLHPTKSFILWTRSSVRQANRIQLEFSKASMNAKRALRQLFWRSTDLTFLQIIIVANRPTLPFSWGGGRRFVTGRAKSRTDAGRLWTSTKHCRPPTSLQQLQATHLIIYPKPRTPLAHSTALQHSI